MKKLFICLFIFVLLAFSAGGCGGLAESSTTEAPTQKPTAAPTQAPTTATEAPTPTPTEAPTVEATENNVEPGTFEVIISEIPTEAPTEATTAAPSYAGSPILGTWRLDHYQQPNGQETKANRVITYVFNADGTFTMTNSGKTATGRFTYANNVISYTADATSEQGSFRYEPAKKQLVDVDESSGMSAILVKS